MVDISKSFPSFIWRTSGSHQIWLAILSAIVFGLTAAPLEIQRRVVNDAFKGGQFSTILLLAGIYLAVSLASGLTKLALNVYRNRVGENVVRDLRTSIDQKIRIDITQQKAAEAEGVEMSLVVAEIGAGWAIRRQRGFRADAARRDTPQHIGLHGLSAAAHGARRSWRFSRLSSSSCR